jgi:hypothetical protein
MHSLLLALLLLPAVVVRAPGGQLITRVISLRSIQVGTQREN